MQELSLYELEIRLRRHIRKWYDELVEESGYNSPLGDIDAGNAAELAGEIATDVALSGGVKVIGALEVHCKLSEGWEKE